MYALTLTALAVLFALLTWQVAAGGPLVRADAALRDAAARAAPPGGAVRGTAQFCADLGGAFVAFPVLALGACVLGRRRRSLVPPLLAALAALAVPALVLPLKAAVARTGPNGAPLGDYAGYYPSGHAATAALAYGALALLCARRAPYTPYAYAAAAVLNVCVGAGLVLCGYHWATDVVVSWALAGLVLCALSRLNTRRSTRLNTRIGTRIGARLTRRAGPARQRAAP
ncbi:phosphatase PAP2 family protein [Streptomyces armeniacus]|uniref:phosphatase PAP2 family protein n=1 Tax=Streptomyces armeniacus TaxID=83291 RepID=UPI001FE4E115|nr:phosphatase PAP2 family protein [Streptomyces armeniacus]